VLKHLDRILFAETVPAYFAVLDEGVRIDAPSLIREAEEGAPPAPATKGSSSTTKPADEPPAPESGTAVSDEAAGDKPAPKKKITVQKRLGSGPISAPVRPDSGPRKTATQLPRLAPPATVSGPTAPSEKAKETASTSLPATAPAPAAPKIAKLTPPGQRVPEPEPSTEIEAETEKPKLPRLHIPGKDD